MTMDVTVMVYGFIKERGTGNEPPMTWSWENPEAGYHAQHADRPLAALPDHHRAQRARDIRCTGRAGTISWG